MPPKFLVSDFPMPVYALWLEYKIGGTDRLSQRVDQLRDSLFYLGESQQYAMCEWRTAVALKGRTEDGSPVDQEEIFKVSAAVVEILTQANTDGRVSWENKIFSYETFEDFLARQKPPQQREAIPNTFVEFGNWVWTEPLQ